MTNVGLIYLHNYLTHNALQAHFCSVSLSYLMTNYSPPLVSIQTIGFAQISQIFD